uniref:RsbT co-antagonist protein RsbRD N-terminal domain-containing protein n=1 Tax=Thermodesulfobacterium geofontis TaxID=1295609 RepID=A0A7V4N478_9BACT
MQRKSISLSQELIKYLENKKDGILKKWKSIFWDSFGEEAKRFFTKEVDRFQNPFGYRIDETFEGLIGILFGDFNWEEADYYLRRLIQLRAIQETIPSKALNMFIQLKGIIREEIGEDILKKFGIEEFVKLEDRINAFIIRGFDFFINYREKLNQIRYNEWKRAYFLLLKRAGLVYDPMEGMPKSESEEIN